MARRGAAFGAVLLLAALLVPAASGQLDPLPKVAAAHDVLSVRVPLAPDGSGSLQVPVAGGLLDIDLVPAPLAGAGGEVDAEAYIASVTFLLADGTSIPLPSMVILAKDLAVDGELGQALANLAAAADGLAEAVLGLQAEPADDVLAQVAGLQDQVAALAEEAAWIQAMAEAMAGVATEGAEEMLATFAGTLATLDAALLLLEDGLARIAEQVDGLNPMPSSSASPSPSPSASSTSSPSPLLDPEMAAAAEEAFDAAMAEAESRLAEAQDALGFVASVLEEVGGEAGQRAADAAAFVGGALNGVVAALGEARLEAERLQGEIAARAGENASAAQASIAEMQDAAAAAIADLAWATDWLEAAAEFAPAALAGPIDDAQRAAGVANGTAFRMLAVVQEHAPLQADALAEQLGQQLADAQAAAAEAALLLEPVVGALDPDVEVDDADGLLVCSGAASSRACLTYRAPASDAGLGTVQVLIALPMGDPLLVDLPGSLTSLTSSLTGLPTPTLPPLPTGLPTGFPSSSSSSSSSAASSPSASSSASSSSSAAPAPPALAVQADRDALALRMGEHGSLVVTVRNEGAAADTVRLTAQATAPVALDTPTAALELGPGESGTFTVRVTPVEAGSGVVELLATGDAAGTVKDTVSVDVAPATPAAANIAASYQPAALAGAVGQSLAISLRLANEGPVADQVAVAVSGNGFAADPATIEVDLQPGEAVLREVRVTPAEPGAHTVLLVISSQRGADLRPIVLLEAGEAGPSEAGDGSDGESTSAKAKGSPALGPLAVAGAVALVFLAVRRRLA